MSELHPKHFAPHTPSWWTNRDGSINRRGSNPVAPVCLGGGYSFHASNSTPACAEIKEALFAGVSGGPRCGTGRVTRWVDKASTLLAQPRVKCQRGEGPLLPRAGAARSI
jgi:hypothetical protein